MELVFIHGWGFDARFWDALAPLLPEYGQHRVDLGFYGHPAPMPDTRDAVLIGHSLGFVHGLRQKQDWRACIAINSFPRFVRTETQAGCADAAELRELKIHLTSNAGNALQGFYDWIEADGPEGTPDVERLRAGLDELRDGDISGILESMEAPALVLGTRDDPVMSPKVSEALCASVRHGVLLWHETGGHILPKRDPVWCAQAIKDFLGGDHDMNNLARHFDIAAPLYDRAASAQLQIATHLVAWVKAPVPPADVADAGAGTGFVASEVLQRWPGASVTAVDNAVAMLRQAQQKMPRVNMIAGDAAVLELPGRFDAVFSSMALHWMPDPMQALRRWQTWLKPEGRLYIALLVQGSFREWAALCMAAGQEDGLWEMPPADFLEDAALRSERETLPVTYPSALDFLRRFKATGTSMPRKAHVPFTIPVMRRILERAPQPFTVSYEALYIELPSSPII